MPDWYRAACRRQPVAHERITTQCTCRGGRPAPPLWSWPPPRAVASRGPRRGNLADRGDDVGIRAAAAEIPAHELANLRIGVSSPFIQQGYRGNDLTGRAVATL